MHAAKVMLSQLSLLNQLGLEMKSYLQKQIDRVKMKKFEEVWLVIKCCKSDAVCVELKIYLQKINCEGKDEEVWRSLAGN